MHSDNILRVFISSPSDVRPERLIAERVVQRLDREFSYHFRLEATLWEYKPLLAAHHFQDQENIPPPSKADIVVVILWSRLGSPLPADRFTGAVSGKVPVTGTEWEFEDALAAYRQIGRPELLLYRKTSPVTANLDDRATLEKQFAQKKMVEDFISCWIRSNPDGEFDAASNSFSDAAAFEENLEVHLRELLCRRLQRAGDEPVPATMRWHRGSPFRGLESFEQEHAPIFFGRNKARIELREVLVRQAARKCAFIMVTGASGVGKSSLIKAGLIPDLMLPGMVGNVALCRVAVMRPSLSVDGPTVGLVESMLAPGALPELSALRYTSQRLAAMLHDHPEQVVQAIEQGLAQVADANGLTSLASARLIVVVDQFEELFTLDRLTQDERRAFVRALSVLARSGLVWVLTAMRSDFFDRLPTLPELLALSSGEARYLLAPPDGSEIGQIIRRPAREAGLRYETDFRGIGLDEVLCEASANNPASLPLLEFTLDQLWHRRSEAGLLTFAAYHSIKELKGSIGHRAETVLDSLPAEVQAALPPVLRSLVTVDVGGKATARPAPLPDFPDATPERRLVEAFLAPEARLLVVEDDGGGPHVRLAHEALLTRWQRACNQIAEDSSDLQLRTRLEQATALWEGAGPRDKDSLLLRHGLPLSEAEDLLNRRREALSPRVAAYVSASIIAQHGSERRRVRRLLATVAVFAAVSILAVVFAWRAILAQEQMARSLELTNDIATILVVDIGERLRSSALLPTEAVTRIQEISNEVVERLVERLSFSDSSLRTMEILKGQLINSVARNQGDMAGRERHGREALEHFARMMDRGDHSPDVLLGAAFSHDTMGDVLRKKTEVALDHYEVALGHYMKAKDLREKARAARPHDVNVLRMLSVSYNRIGNLYMARKNWAMAEEEYRAALSIRRDLLSRAGAGPEAAADASLTLNKLGGALLKADRRTEAIARYKESLEIARREFQVRPNQMRQMNDLAYAHDSLGKVYLEGGDFGVAAEHYEECIRYRQQMVNRDPQNLIYKRDFAMCQAGLGDAEGRMGRMKVSTANLGLAEKIIESLISSGVADQQWKSDLEAIRSIIRSHASALN